jgi:hypothetical protein
LDGNLPEVLIEREYDASFAFCQLQKPNVLPSSTACPLPKDIVSVGAQRNNNRPRLVLVSEYARLRRNRIGFVFVGQTAGVRQAGKNVVSRQPGVVR